MTLESRGGSSRRSMADLAHRLNAPGNLGAIQARLSGNGPTAPRDVKGDVVVPPARRPRGRCSRPGAARVLRTVRGGIIALGLGLGLSAHDILAFYEAQGPMI